MLHHRTRRGSLQGQKHTPDPARHPASLPSKSNGALKRSRRRRASSTTSAREQSVAREGWVAPPVYLTSQRPSQLVERYHRPSPRPCPCLLARPLHAPSSHQMTPPPSYAWLLQRPSLPQVHHWQSPLGRWCCWSRGNTSKAGEAGEALAPPRGEPSSHPCTGGAAENKGLIEALPQQRSSTVSHAANESRTIQRAINNRSTPPRPSGKGNLLHRTHKKAPQQKLIGALRAPPSGRDT